MSDKPMFPALLYKGKVIAVSEKTSTNKEELIAALKRLRSPSLVIDFSLVTFALCESEPQLYLY